MEIIKTPLRLDLYGLSAAAINKDYVGTAFSLSGKMWETIRTNNLKNKGKNNWVYLPDEMVFTGVELDNIPEIDTGLEQKSIILSKYAYYKYIGPYNLIKQIGLNLQTELKSHGLESTLPTIEIYGHWTNDETKLETELLIALK